MPYSDGRGRGPSDPKNRAAFSDSAGTKFGKRVMQGASIGVGTGVVGTPLSGGACAPLIPLFGFIGGVVGGAVAVVEIVTGN